MATRTKTIKIPVNFNNVADLADNVQTTLGTTTIYIPENSVSNPVTFESVMLFFSWQNTVNNVDLLSFSTNATLSGSTGSSFTVSGSIVDSGEEMSGVIGPIDYTSYFTINFGTVTSKNFTVQVTADVAGGVSRGVYCYVEITYQFDDTAGKLIQTICVPYEFSGSLPTTQTTVVTLRQLTLVGGLLNGNIDRRNSFYSDLDIKYRWIHIKGNSNANNNTTDITLSFSFDEGATTTLPVKEQGGGPDNWVEYQINSSNISEDNSHTFQLWSSVATRFTNIIISEWLTFEFTTSGTTDQVINYIEYPIETTWPVGTGTTEFSRYGRDIIIPEPNTISMENCAVEIVYNTNLSATANLRVGTQNFSTYAMLANVTAGGYGFQHRFDSGSNAGAGVTLTRGTNVINVDIYESSGDITNITGLVKLLYRSGVSNLGIPSHSRIVTKRNSVINLNSVSETNTDNNLNFLTDEGNYYIHGFGYQSHYWTQTNGQFLSVKAELLSNELDGDGNQNMYTDWYLGDNEVTYSSWNASLFPYYKSYPEQPTDLIDLTQTRNYKSSATSTTKQGSKLFTSYHNITFQVSGNITGSNNGTIRLDIYQEGNTGEYNLYQTKTVTGNTSYSFDVYDDTVNYQVVAYETSSYKGVSKTDTPAINFDISLASSTGGEYGYAFG
jgi:hypothetical protein